MQSQRRLAKPARQQLRDAENKLRAQENKRERFKSQQGEVQAKIDALVKEKDALHDKVAGLERRVGEAVTLRENLRAARNAIAQLEADGAPATSGEPPTTAPR